MSTPSSKFDGIHWDENGVITEASPEAMETMFDILDLLENHPKPKKES